MYNILTEPVVLVAIGGAAVTIVDRLKKRYFNAKVESVFVRDMATNHLPHIYHALTQQSAAMIKIGSALNVDVEIDLNNPPPIQFISEEK
jgi:hypothetical protein